MTPWPSVCLRLAASLETVSMVWLMASVGSGEHMHVPAPPKCLNDSLITTAVSACLGTFTTADSCYLMLVQKMGVLSTSSRHQHRPQHATQLACRYVKFDTYHPAVSKGLPITRVISRTLLQKILAEAAMELAGEDVISNGVHVVRYEDVRPGSPCLLHLCVTVRQHTGQAAAAQQTADREPSCLMPRFDWARWLQVKVGGKDQVAAVTADGQKITGDILIGADGIRSKVGCPTSRFNTCHAGRR